MREITFKPTPKQFVAWGLLTDDETTELGWGGGAGGGKSWLGCFWLLSSCLAYPGTRWLLGRKELVNLKRTTLKTFYKVCAEYSVEPDKDFSLNQQTNTITFRNGSEMVLFDLSTSPKDPEYTRLGGLELTGAFVDESNEVDEKAISILRTRIGRQRNQEFNLKPRLLETFNPNKGHVYLRYYKPFKTGTLPVHRKFIQALATDNPHLTQDYIEELKKGDRATVERLLHGNFDYDDDPYLMVSYDAATDLFTNTVEDEEKRYLTADIARLGGDLIVIMCWQGMEAYRVEWMSRMSLDSVAGKIRDIAAQESIPWSRVLVDEAGLGQGVVDMLRGIKGFVGASAPLVMPNEKTPQNYANLRSQCFFMLAKAIEERKMAVRVADPMVRERITLELAQVKRLNDGTERKLRIVAKEDMKKALGFSPDFVDTLSMRMFFEVRQLPDAERHVEKPLTSLEREFYDRMRQKAPLASRL
jgi:hypothetical protein